MGCTSSKLDDLPAVALCRERCAFLEAAIQQRYALAESHVAYTHTLRAIGPSLHLFINHHHRLLGGGRGGGGDSPKLNLPPQRKGDPEEDDDDDDSPKKGKLAAHHLSHSGSGSGSGSGSHLHFNSDSEDEDEDDLDSLHHSDHSSPLPQHLGGGVVPREAAPIGFMDSGFTRYPNPEMMGPYAGGYLHMNYMKNKAMPPSVVYEQRPMSPRRVYMGESSSSSASSYFPYPYPPNSNSSYPFFGYPNYGPGPYRSSPPRYGSSSPSGASSSKPPPPPPQPPSNSALDFLNPFDTYDMYYPPYTPSRDSKELREEEGIPDLEDEDSQDEVVKEVLGNQKFVARNHPKPAMDDEEEPQPIKAAAIGSSGGGGGGGGGSGDASLYQTRSRVSVENEGMEYEVHVLDKKVVENEKNEGRRTNAAARRGGGGPREVPEVAKEIEIQFVRAAESGSEIFKILEVGKLPYHRKHASSKMLHVVTPSLSVVSSQPSTSNSADASSSARPSYLDIEEELALRSRNLSSTLHKLHLWEKKLFREVKAEEKLRVAHDRKWRKLQRLDERGAEAQKVDSTRTLVRSLSTKIRIAIQVVDKISVTINKIRDEELWPLLNELIQGLTRMWRSMLECHQSQCEAIREAKGLGPIRSGKKLGDDHLEATRTLGHELINWILGFSSWVSAQKCYVRALNSWLLKCLNPEPEETPDGIAPFSPGRMGAPPIFVICNQWSQALDRISEKEVVEAMRSFTTSVLQLWEQDRLEMMPDNMDPEKRVRNLDREEQKIQREIQALEKKMVLVAPGGDGNSLSISGNVVYQSETSNNSLQGGLQRIFEAMESFTAECMKAYEDLLQRVEEETAPQETSRE